MKATLKNMKKLKGARFIEKDHCRHPGQVWRIESKVRGINRWNLWARLDPHTGPISIDFNLAEINRCFKIEQ